MRKLFRFFYSLPVFSGIGVLKKISGKNLGKNFEKINCRIKSQEKKNECPKTKHNLLKYFDLSKTKRNPPILLQRLSLYSLIQRHLPSPPATSNL